MARTGKQRLNNPDQVKENSKQRRERIAKELEARETFFKVYVPIIAAFLVLLVALMVYRTSLTPPTKMVADSLDQFEKNMTDVDMDEAEELIQADEV
eukprot:Nk52_evm3s245 gene=Nk52_evmTU3s245